MRPAAALAGLLVLAAHAKAHFPGDVPEDHEANTFRLPDGNPIRQAYRRFLREQARQVAGFVERLGVELPASFPPLADYTDAMAAAMTPLLGVYWSRSGRALRGRLGLDPADWRVTDPNIHRAIAAQAFDFCASTNAAADKALADALADLRAELAAGLGGRSENTPELTPGESVPELARRVRKVFAGLSREKATTIARTEAARAVHAAALLSAEQSGVVARKRWLTSANSCPLCHRLADAVGAIALDARFATVGRSETYAAIRHPPAHPHCRCSMTFELLGDEPATVAAFARPEPEPAAAAEAA